MDFSHLLTFLMGGFVALLLAPYVSWDEWLQRKITARVKAELIEEGYIKNDQA